MAVRESEVVAWLRERLPGHRRLLLGVGDDAAVLDWAASDRCVVTVDLLMDGVDFELERVEARRVGHKALAVNLSDLAAMAARPVAAVVALALPQSAPRELVYELYEGMIPLAERFDLVIAGGDINSWNGPLAISITALGEPTGAGPLRRDGAKPGDRIVVTGLLGGSILGRHLDVEPRVSEALRLHEQFTLHGAIDISDGLTLDLSRLAEASGCGAVLNLARVPVAPAAETLAAEAADGTTALDHALGDGEDFELILAVPPDEARRLVEEKPVEIALTDIGEFVAERGLWQVDPSGARRRLEVRGWEHRLES